MKGYVIIKNIKGNLEDITEVIPEKNVDYTLLVDVSLLEKRVKQVEADDEDEDTTFIFEPSGRMHLVKTNPNASTAPDYSLEAGHIVPDEIISD